MLIVSWPKRGVVVAILATAATVGIAVVANQWRSKSRIVSHPVNQLPGVETGGILPLNNPPDPLEAIDPKGLEQGDQVATVERVIEGLRKNDPAAVALATRVLPNVGPEAEAVWPELLALTCHPDESVRDATWKALARVRPTGEGEGSAVLDHWDKLWFWCERAATPQKGGDTLYQSLMLLTVLEEAAWDKLVLQMAKGGQKSRQLAKTTLDKLESDERLASRRQALLGALCERLTLRPPKRSWEPPKSPGGLDDKVWMEFQSRAEWATDRVECEAAFQASERVRKQKGPKPSVEDLATGRLPRNPADDPLATSLRRREFEADWNRRKLDRTLRGSPSDTFSARFAKFSPEVQAAYHVALCQAVADFLIDLGKDNKHVRQVFANWSRDSEQPAIRKIGEAGLQAVTR